MAWKENVIFLGPPGVGKSHLSVALGMKALPSVMTVYFVSVADLVRLLYHCTVINIRGRETYRLKEEKGGDLDDTAG